MTTAWGKTTSAAYAGIGGQAGPPSRKLQKGSVGRPLGRGGLSLGVSIVALSLASQAFAQQAQTVSPGAKLPFQYKLDAGQTAETGRAATGSPSADSTVDSVDNGTIEQTAGGESGVSAKSLDLTNAGAVALNSSATAFNANGQAISQAELLDGITQQIAGKVGPLSATARNSGTLKIGALAIAEGTELVGDVAGQASSVLIGGFHQEVTVEGGGDGVATAAAINEGLYNAFSSAQATAHGDTLAEATIQESLFMRSQANGAGDGTTLATFKNSGQVNVSSSAVGTSSDGNVAANAMSGGGEHGLIHLRAAANGVGDDSATVIFGNDAGGTLLVHATGAATALRQAEASALADGAIVMKAQTNGQDEGDIVITLGNRGHIGIDAASTAHSTGNEGGAVAVTTLNSAIVQTAEASGPEFFLGRSGVSTVDNKAGASISIAGTAEAASAGESTARVELAPAILQEAELIGSAETRFNNAGAVAAMGTSLATGESAQGSAIVGGVEHEIFGLADAGGARSVFDNSGTLAVGALAEAVGSNAALADARSFGLNVWGEPVSVAVTNSGNFDVSSVALATDGTAAAQAVGMRFGAVFNPTIFVPEEEEGHGHGGNEGHSPENGQNGHGGEHEDGPVVWEEEAANTISGTVDIAGGLTVSATADGAASSASATGLYFEAAVSDATLSNRGTIDVSAASNAGISVASGVVLRDFYASPIVPGEGDVFTLLNDGGTIIARQSTDLGQSWVRGLAIDSSEAPNAVDIRFLGASNVFGHIDISADDRITIAGGETRLDGLINPDAVKEGSLSIGSGATLFLTRPDHGAPAGGYVEYFEVANGGTLALELPLTSGSATTAGIRRTAAVTLASSYPQIFADVAVLDGTLQIRPSSSSVLYEDSYVFQDIIDADSLYGAFSEVEMQSGSPLLSASLSYDTQDNVDLLLTRIGFGDVAGLTFNQAATGDGIEAVYSAQQTGAYAALLAQLFTLDGDQYAAALDQISGDQYAGFVQNLRDSSIQINSLLSDQLDCAVSAKSIDYCRDPNQGVRFFSLGGYNDSTFDTDVNAPGYKSKYWFGLAGFDYTSGNLAVGAFGGFRHVKMLFDRNSGTIDADGFQLGFLASYDVGDIYLRGHGSYTWLDGKSSRIVQIGPVAGTISGTPDAGIWSLYGEAGGRVPLGSTWLTPFAAIDHSSVSIHSFTESGVAGANLELPGQSDSQTSLLAGLKWAGNLGILTPEAKVAFRHDFGDPYLTTTARFADAPGGGLFSVRSPGMDQDSVLAGFSLAAALSDQVTARLGYQGRFGGGADDNAIFGSLVIRPGAVATLARAARTGAESGTSSNDTVLRLGFDVQGIYSDNIFATRNDKIDDFILAVRPSARLVLGDRSTYLEVGGRGDLARNAAHTSENFSDWTIDLDSRLKLNDSASMIFDGEYQWSHEARTSSEAVFGLTPALYERGRGVAGLLLRHGRFTGRFAGSLTRYNYSDVKTSVGFINNDDRDRTATEFVGRIGYKVTPSTNLFVQASIDDTRYEAALDDFGYDRNSHGYGAVVGIGVKLGQDFTGEIFTGVLERSYSDPAFEDTTTFDLGVLLEWTGARSNASFRVDRSIEDTIFPGASSYVLTNGYLSFSTYAGPRLAAGISVGGTQYSYSGVDRREFVVSSDIWTRYWFDEHLFAGIGYNFSQRASNAAGYDYDENRFLLTIGSQLQPRYLDSSASLNWGDGDLAPGGAYGAVLMGHGTLVSGVTGPREFQASSTADFGDVGAAYGLALGYGTVLDPIYLGLELAATLDGPSWQHSGGRNYSVRKDNGLELAARIGYVTKGRAIVYGRFGLASARFTTDYATSSAQARVEGRQFGMSVGFGVEAPAFQRSFVRAEYVINGYRDYDVPLAGSAGDNFSSVEGQFRLGFGFRFGRRVDPFPMPGETDLATHVDFSGAFAGLVLGHGALTTRTIGAREAQPMLDVTRSSHGGMLGGVAGYGWLAGDFYFGAEVEADMSSIDWNLQSDPDGRSYSSRHQYSWGTAARIGSLISPNALAYARVGVVRTRFDSRYRFGDLSVKSKDVRTGLQLGGGMEIGLGSTSRLRVEYIVNRYRSYDIFYGQGSENFNHSESIFRTGFIFDL